MRRSLAIAGGVAAGVTAIALAAGPAIALGSTYAGKDNGNTQCTGQGNGNGQGQGQGNRQGKAGSGREGMARGGNGAGVELSNVASGTLTDAQKAQLAGMAEEEKLAHDLYVALAAKYPETKQFSRISQAETKHLTAVRELMTRYSIPDPTAGKAEGTFASATMQTLYNNLLAGATTSQKALAAGVTVEKTDIADLAKAGVGVTAPDVKLVYSKLTAGSERHLRAFGG